MFSITLKRSLGAVSLALVLAGFAAAQKPATISANTPTLRLKSVGGKIHDIAEMRGEVVVASFGATWCAPCHAEVLALEELMTEYKGKPVRFLWISIESERDISDAVLRHRAKGMRLTMPVLRDTDQRAFAQFSDKRRMPMVVVFDKTGAPFTAPLFGMAEPEVYKKRLRGTLDAALRATTAANARPATPVAP